MKEEIVLGIFVNKNKTFYYLEAGPAMTQQGIDKLRTTLTAKNLINIVTDSGLINDYRVISLAQAKLDDVNIEPVYLNKHIEASHKIEHAKQLTTIWDDN